MEGRRGGDLPSHSLQILRPLLKSQFIFNCRHFEEFWELARHDGEPWWRSSRKRGGWRDFRVGKDTLGRVPPLKEKKNVVSHHFTEFFEMKAIYIAYKSREMLEYCCT